MVYQTCGAWKYKKVGLDTKGYKRASLCLNYFYIYL